MTMACLSGKGHGKKGFLDFMNASETRAEQISAKLWKIVERNKRQN